MGARERADASGGGCESGRPDPGRCVVTAILSAAWLVGELDALPGGMGSVAVHLDVREVREHRPGVAIGFQHAQPSSSSQRTGRPITLCGCAFSGMVIWLPPGGGSGSRTTTDWPALSAYSQQTDRRAGT